MRQLKQLFHEAVVAYSGTDDTHSSKYKDTYQMLVEATNSEKSAYINDMMKDISKWSKASANRNKEIYDTKGDIAKFNPNLMDVINALDTSNTSSYTFNQSYSNGSSSNMSSTTSSGLRRIRGLYSHFNINKNTYINAFKNGNETLKTVYVSGTWLIISYITQACIKAASNRAANPDAKYGKMIEQFADIIGHPNFIEYMETAEKSTLNTESILYEGVLAVGTALVGMIVGLRLIQWNIFTMRTKISDKLKVSAEYLEKNASRLKNTDKKNKDKIAEKQLKAADTLNKAAEFLRIKMDDETPTKPPEPRKKTPTNDTNDSTDDDDDFEL